MNFCSTLEHFYFYKKYSVEYLSFLLLYTIIIGIWKGWLCVIYFTALKWPEHNVCSD